MPENFKAYLKSKWGLTDEEVSQLHDFIKTREVRKDEYLLKEGQVCKHTFFVEEGLLRFYALNENGKADILQFASENWLVSDRGSVYFNQPSHYYIDAIENSVVVLIDDEFMDRVSIISPNFRKYNERLLQNHILHLNRRVRLLLGASAKVRYLDFITLYPDVLLRVPQWMVASYLGITPESLSRVRRDLAKNHFNG
jgi:CRP-like cAMP-binding protein